MSALLYCTAEGIPDVTFTWTFEGVVVHDSNPRIRNETVKLDHVTYQGILIIDDVMAKDFGEYICVARNELGFETIQVALLPDGIFYYVSFCFWYLRFLNIKINTFFGIFKSWGFVLIPYSRLRVIYYTWCWIHFLWYSKICEFYLN